RRLGLRVAAPGVDPKSEERPVLDPAFEAAWRAVASATCRSPKIGLFEGNGIDALFERAPHDVLARQEIVRHLTPVLRLRSAGSLRAIAAVIGASGTRPARVTFYLDGDVHLTCGDLASTFAERLRTSAHREAILAAMADDLTSLLKRTLDLFA